MARSFMKAAYAPLALMLVVVALMSVANATTPPPISPGECKSKDYQCCQLVEFSDKGIIPALLNAAGIVLTGVAELVGVSCVPIDLLDLTQPDKCRGKPLCCSNRNFNGGILPGLLAIGCVPINIDL